MASVEDVTNFSKKLKTALSLVEKSKNISDDDKKSISEFYFSLRRNNIKISTQIGHINTLKRAYDHMGKLGIKKSFHDIDLFDYDRMLDYFENTCKHKQGTINQFKKTMRKYMKWKHGSNVPQWVLSEIKLIRAPTPIQPNDIPTREEFTEFLEAAKNQRDRAIIAVCGNAGIRIGALLSCTRSSVVETKHGIILYLSKEGQNKTTPAKGVPLTWSSGELKRWLAVHPIKDDENAPLWTTLRKKKSPSGEMKHEALSYGGAYMMFHEIEKQLNHGKHIHPHTMRHYAVTSWILDGLREQDINYMAGWVKDSKQMISTYGNFADDDMNDRIFEFYGLKTEDRRQVILKTCPLCGNVLKPDDKFCSQCATALDQKALSEKQSVENAISKMVEKLILSNPKFLKELLDNEK